MEEKICPLSETWQDRLPIDECILGFLKAEKELKELKRKAAAFDALEAKWNKTRPLQEGVMDHWLAWTGRDSLSMLEAVERDLMGKEE